MGNELTYVLLALISALGFLLVVFIFLYLKSQRSLAEIQKNLDLLKKEKADLENAKLSPVNDQARLIIDAANQKAKEIIASVQGLSEQEKGILNASFQKMLAENLQEYKKAAAGFTQTYDGFVANIGRDVKARLDMGLNKVLSDAQAEMKNTGLKVSSSMENLYKGYEAEVAEYKKGILKQMDKLGVDIIKQVSLKTLGKTLSKKEQEDLVVKSLEEAKKLGFFE
jgi:hypothetical protein